jgi:hypothetical protein
LRNDSQEKCGKWSGASRAGRWRERLCRAIGRTGPEGGAAEFTFSLAGTVVEFAAFFISKRSTAAGGGRRKHHKKQRHCIFYA